MSKPLDLPPTLPPLARQVLRQLVARHGSPAVHDALNAIDEAATQAALDAAWGFESDPPETEELVETYSPFTVRGRGI